jgi:DNA-directed RNA polymerase III subunit RPC6
MAEVASGGGAALTAEAVLMMVLSEKTNGITDADLEADQRMKTFKADEIAMGINALIQKNRLELLQSAAGTLMYKLISEEEAVKLAGLSREQQVVYRTIAKAGNKGLWSKEIKSQTNLSKEVDKILKALISRRLIKCEKHHKTLKKVYMLFELTPDPEIAGGSWYTGQEFDLEFIESLQKIAVQFFRKNGKASLDELSKFIVDTGISKIALTLKDVQTLVNTLVLDGAIEVAPELGSTRDMGRRKAMTMFRPTKTTNMDDKDPYVSIPCSVCPVTADCIEGTEVSPATCEYYRMWLDF